MSRRRDICRGRAHVTCNAYIIRSVAKRACYLYDSSAPHSLRPLRPPTTFSITATRTHTLSQTTTIERTLSVNTDIAIPPTPAAPAGPSAGRISTPRNLFDHTATPGLSQSWQPPSCQATSPLGSRIRQPLQSHGTKISTSD